VLAADDDGAVVRWLRRALEPEGFLVEEASDAGALVAGLARDPDVVLLDLRLGDAQGVELIPEIRRRSPDTEIVVMTGYASVDSAVACMRAGAFDYLEKPFPDRVRVAHTLRCALERRRLRTRNRELETELEERSALARIVGQSPPMRRVLQLVRDLARSESSVLIQAESGTGKELLARAFHETSPRRAGPFVPVDCGALPEGIFESELFGHARGAFTGATRESPGLFRAANGGTLFLDEVGELPLALQAKLLRALQEREVRPLGAAGAVPVDVRVVAATNRDLDAEVRAGRFRTDLFYRLRVVEVALPPLRERREDIPLLVAHFLERSAAGGGVGGIEPDALAALLHRPWPGNVRELANAIEAAAALARGPRLTLADLRVSPAEASAEATAAAPGGLELSLAAWERACIEATLQRVGGDVRRAAALLRVGRSTLYRKLRKGSGGYGPGFHGG
jgi:DNA-binding NtrC family response regulator